MERVPDHYRILTFAQAQMETQKEMLNIGPVPYNEEWNVHNKNPEDCIFECAVYIRQLIRHYGPPPGSCEFFIMKNEQSSQIFWDANIFYSSKNAGEEQQSYRYAFAVENGMEYWDEHSKLELDPGKHPSYMCKIIPITGNAIRS